MVWIHRFFAFIYSALLLFTIAAGAWFLAFTEGDARPPQVAHHPAPAQPAPSPVNPPSQQDSITEASEALVLFLSARTAAQCSLFIREPDQHFQSLRSYIANRIPQEVVVSYRRSESRAGGHLGPVHWFELNLLEESRRLEVPIYPTDVGYKLDWRTFSRAYGSGFTTFASNAASTSRFR